MSTGLVCGEEYAGVLQPQRENIPDSPLSEQEPKKRQSQGWLGVGWGVKQRYRAHREDSLWGQTSGLRANDQASVVDGAGGRHGNRSQFKKAAVVH